MRGRSRARRSAHPPRAAGRERIARAGGFRLRYAGACSRRRGQPAAFRAARARAGRGPRRRTRRRGAGGRAARAGACRGCAAGGLAGRGRPAGRSRHARGVATRHGPASAWSRRVARGRLAWLALATDDLALARRALAAVDVPAVAAVTGPRSAATDALLAEQDQIVLVVPADADPSRRARTRRPCGIERSGIVRGPLAPGARAAALAGWGRLKVPA